ncbi:acyl-CoA dehydrogenase/oxidase C-terminal [Eremomyces bilateralis CBS 781.70]|uniref:Acyl-CoA dehydrogenase/oxidase C-terminal n=1 Tax=Eremomyces bilateralis CBS 781.70 TaxID=1392243 RepID=A0A6G1G5P5_9PEZI|nr:acyl-CoA dehydrogenase/oxidase C-terminal [Eremomyces bilateralis CBS 781.70]KAF1813383.1 acyl-CoA dehydrogenase/oxidase C-terminal [Eremomyces bilateralis CBS 781.70]
MAVPRPSSGTEGFFQTAPKLGNQLTEDFFLNRIYNLYIPKPIQTAIEPDLSAFGAYVVSPDVFSLVADAERNPPTVSTHSLFGVPRTTLDTSRGWQELQKIGIKHGILAIAYEEAQGHHSRMYQFVKYHLWTGSNACVTCPTAMADGAARLLSNHLAKGGLSLEQEQVFRAAYQHLTSRDPENGWTSGQWMTERSGGSDVRGTETVATYAPQPASSSFTDAHGSPLGPYTVSGFKWFSSATDSQMAVLLAKTPAGISAFYAPMRRASTSPSNPLPSELNGIAIQRLKPKLGTRAVPTAELVLNDTRAWMVGQDGHGVREIASVLNITRLYTGITALSYWGRGLAIARAYARVRKVDGGVLLTDVPSHLRTLARITVSYSAMMHLGYFVVALMGIVENPGAYEKSGEAMQTAPVQDVKEATALLRLLLPVMKGQCSKLSIGALQECMEALGGVGYLEDEQEFNVSRIYRDASVNSIWEGTTDIMGTDVARVMKGKGGVPILKALGGWVARNTNTWTEEWGSAAELVMQEFKRLEEVWIGLQTEELRFRGRELLNSLSWIVSTVCLVGDAQRDNHPVMVEVSKRWIGEKQPKASIETENWRSISVLDKLVVFGADSTSSKL